jgi:hypothetical protein
MFDWIDDGILTALKSDQLSKTLYDIMITTPEIGQFFIVFAYMYYDLFNDASRAQFSTFITNTKVINLYRKKIEMLIIISKHVPKLDLNMNIPQELYPLITLFGLTPSPDMHIKFLSDYINTHLPILFTWITTNISVIEQKINDGFAKLKSNIKFGGKKSRKRRRTKKYKSRK